MQATQPLVSICIPTYNRSACLKQTLDSILPQKEFVDGRVEVVINDNASTDDTEVVSKSYTTRYSNIHYFKNPENLLDRNFPITFSRATGKLRKLNNDTAVLLPGALKYLCDMEQKYEDLRFLSRQYGQRIADVSRLKTQLLDHLDQTMPGITSLLALKSRTPDNCVLLLFIKRFNSFDEIHRIGKPRFLSAYSSLVKKTTDRYAASKALAIYELALNSITTRGDDPYIWSVQRQCVDLLASAQNAADTIILQMQNIAETIPEYKVLRSMHGVGDRLGPIILAEIGDIRRFHSGKALNSYAGNDAPPYQSGQFESKNRHISKRGSPALRKACFEVMQALKLTKPQDDPVYLFMLKKEQEGKPHNVAKMAGVNKFLRIYYARAMALYK